MRIYLFNKIYFYYLFLGQTRNVYILFLGQTCYVCLCVGVSVTLFVWPNQPHGQKQKNWKF